MRTRQFVTVLLLLFLISASGTVLAQPPVQDIPGGTIVATGLNGPQGVLVDPDGNLWIVDSGLGGDTMVDMAGPDGEMVSVSVGMTARVVMVAPDGTQTDVAMLPSILLPEEGETLGGARLALLDGTLYVTSGGFSGDGSEDPPDPLMAAIVRVDGSELTPVATTWPNERDNNPDGTLIDTHPYGLSAGPDGWLWVADAGGNDLLRVNPDTGEVVVVAAFGGLPGAFPNPDRGGAVEADPVPTGVAFDAMGDAYVSLLSGGPFIPGNAKVLMVTSDGTVSDYATGLTMLTDIKRGPDGELYAVQFGQFTEEGPVPNAGALLRIKEGGASEVVISGLPFPTGLAFDSNGSVYIAVNSVGAPGSGAVVRFDDVSSMPGEPLPMPM